MSDKVDELVKAVEVIRKMCRTVSSNPNYNRVDIAETVERHCNEAISNYNSKEK